MKDDIIRSSEIGVTIRKRRKELGLSQEKLAEMVGVSYQQIQRYESGYSLLNVENVQRIAKPLNMVVTDFFTKPQPASIAEVSVTFESYMNTEEKNLIRQFKKLSSQSDKDLTLAVIRRMTKD